MNFGDMMDDIEMLMLLQKNCGDDKLLAEFIKEIFTKEYPGLYAWNGVYDNLIDEYSKK